jgi:hypothetical protein
MKDLERRIIRIEAYQRARDTEGHWIPVLCYPWDLPDDAQEVWLAEQRACTCTPGCPGKRYGALLPAKAPSVEAWSERVQQYYARRRACDA